MATAAKNMLSQSTDETTVFDYESKTWGGHEVDISPSYLGALRLKYCLSDLSAISGTVLEVGCGAGGMARGIAKQRPELRVTGCDISLAAIREARTHTTDVRFELGDTYELPYRDETFNAVVMFDVLEHVDDPEKALSEMARVIPSGGLFHLYVPCEGALHTIHGGLARIGWMPKEQYGGHIQRFVARDVVRMIERSGFQIEHERWSGHLANQIVDAAYFTALAIRGRNVSTSIEGHLATAERSWRSDAIRLATSTVAIASYFESAWFPWLPGLGIHVTGKKI
jgi:SAM-dependent methyltransferase